jgi:phage N-6-adenine-methyltransferase
MSKLSLGVERIAELDRQLAVAGTDLSQVRALEELAEAAKRYAVTHEQRVSATAAKWKIARHGGQVLIDMAERRQRSDGGRPKTTATVAVVSKPTLSDLGLSEQRSTRWQRAARLSAERFQQLLNDILGSDPEDDLGSIASTAHLSSEKDEWATPVDLFAELDAEFHFTLDVCASDGNAKCERYFTVADNALAQEWTGVCWMNPPYSEMDRWLQKALDSSATGATVVCLVPSRTDVGWFWDIARQGEIRFLRGRLSFVDDAGKTGPAPFPSCLVVFGREPGLVWHDR